MELSTNKLGKHDHTMDAQTIYHSQSQLC